MGNAGDDAGAKPAVTVRRVMRLPPECNLRFIL
jgi:hypothetical protein